MNRKGHEPNLKRANPGNQNALKSGVHSPRRRAEEGRKVREALAEDPQAFLLQDELDIYADLRGFSKVLARDIAERGVADRSGKPRRQAGTYLRTLALCKDLSDRIQAGLAADGARYDDAEPFSEAEGLGLLREMAHDDRVGGSARFATVRYLLERVPEDELAREMEFLRPLMSLTDEELERELAALRMPLAEKGAEAQHKRALKMSCGGRGPAEMMLRELAGQQRILPEQFLDLYRALTEELQPGES